MTVVFHLLGCLAVWFVLSAAMGLFVGKFIARGGSTRDSALVRINKREVVEI